LNKKEYKYKKLVAILRKDFAGHKGSKKMNSTRMRKDQYSGTGNLIRTIIMLIKELAS
jgi:hypothetical protein